MNSQPSVPGQSQTDPGGQDVSRHRAPDQFLDLQSRALACQLCDLRSGATQVVFGEGNPSAHIMLVGEGPGADEDRLGRPFVGRAGQLLDRILAAAGLLREEVYIANMVKCRPPKNRNPGVGEIKACFPWLRRQVNLIDPLFILLMGRVPAQAFLGSDAAISRVRGQWHSWEGYLVLPTYHPAALLRDPSRKKPVWDDIRTLMAAYRRLVGDDDHGS